MKFHRLVAASAQDASENAALDNWGSTLLRLLTLHLVVLVGRDLIRKHTRFVAVGLAHVVIHNNLDWRVVAGRGAVVFRRASTRRVVIVIRVVRASIAAVGQIGGCAHGVTASRPGVHGSAISRARRAGVPTSGLVELLLSALVLALGHLASMAVADLAAQRGQEVIQFTVQVRLGDPQVPLEEEEELLLHGVDLLSVEAEVVVVSSHVGVAGPVLVLGGAIVEVLCGQDESGKEDAVSGASDTSSLRLQLRLEAVEIDQAGHESRDLNVGGDNQLGDELLEGWQLRLLVSRLWGTGRRGRKLGPGGDGIADDDVVSGLGEIRDHLTVDGLVDEVLESSLVELVDGDLPGSHDGRFV